MERKRSTSPISWNSSKKNREKRNIKTRSETGACLRKTYYEGSSSDEMEIVDAFKNYPLFSKDERFKEGQDNSTGKLMAFDSLQSEKIRLIRDEGFEGEINVDSIDELTDSEDKFSKALDSPSKFSKSDSRSSSPFRYWGVGVTRQIEPVRQSMNEDKPDGISPSSLNSAWESFKARNASRKKIEELKKQRRSKREVENESQKGPGVSSNENSTDLKSSPATNRRMELTGSFGESEDKENHNQFVSEQDKRRMELTGSFGESEDKENHNQFVSEQDKRRMELTGLFGESEDKENHNQFVSEQDKRMELTGLFGESEDKENHKQFVSEQDKRIDGNADSNEKKTDMTFFTKD